MTSQHTTTVGGAHIAVLGAGLMGRLIAWRLLEETDHQVSLYEAGAFTPSPSAAHTAAAMIAPYSEVVSTETEIYQMGLESLGVWPRWIEQLNGSSQPRVDYSATGSIVVAHPQDLAELQQFKQDLGAKLGTGDDSQWLAPAALAEREPALSHFEQGLYLPREAHLDNRALLSALLYRIQSLGGRCYEQMPMQPGDAPLKDCDWVFDCRGMGAQPQEPELRGVRGEVMWVETPEVTLHHAVRLCHPRYKLYVVPKSEHRFIIGATEIESDDCSPISLQSTLELASALYTIHPAFAEARIIETDVNLRPAYLNNLPRIMVKDHIISINGLYRHGYLAAPVMVEQALDTLNR